MPITIQELIASDTISQAVDKINFNFDQLILNGGGPVGPKGPIGPRGPIGGRGLRGNKWLEDQSLKPGTLPNNLIFSDLVKDDNYLQSNGDVWTWNGTQWELTGVNLIGPTGASGISVGFSFFGENVPQEPRNKQSIYPSPIINDSGMNTNNEGIPTLVVGASISTDTLYPGSGSGNPNSTLTDNLASIISSDIVSLFIHQKTSNSKSIILHGGNTVNDFYELDDISQLSNISLGKDDKLIISAPKPPHPDNFNSDLIGIEVTSENGRGQRFISGKNIRFDTGRNTNIYDTGVPDSANFDVNVNGYSGVGTPPSINLDVYENGDRISYIKTGKNISIQAQLPNNITGKTHILSKEFAITSESSILYSSITGIYGEFYLPDTIENNNDPWILTTTGGGLGRVNKIKNTLSTDNNNPTTVPVGAIIMWSGAINDLPGGWYLCDGSNNTPDLTDRFIIGAGDSYNINDTGGSADAVVVEHNHSGTATDPTPEWRGAIGSVSETFNDDGDVSGVFSKEQGFPSDNTPNAVDTSNAGKLIFNGDHTHPLDISNTGESGVNKNLPPYYALAFIIFKG